MSLRRGKTLGHSQFRRVAKEATKTARAQMRRRKDEARIKRRDERYARHQSRQVTELKRLQEQLLRHVESRHLATEIRVCQLLAWEQKQAKSHPQLVAVRNTRVLVVPVLPKLCLSAMLSAVDILPFLSPSIAPTVILQHVKIVTTQHVGFPASAPQVSSSIDTPQLAKLQTSISIIVPPSRPKKPPRTRKPKTKTVSSFDNVLSQIKAKITPAIVQPPAILQPTARLHQAYAETGYLELPSSSSPAAAYMLPAPSFWYTLLRVFSRSADISGPQGLLEYNVSPTSLPRSSSSSEIEFCKQAKIVGDLYFDRGKCDSIADATITITQLEIIETAVALTIESCDMGLFLFHSPQNVA